MFVNQIDNTDDDEPVVAIAQPGDGEWHEFHADNIAEVVSLPGGLLQVVRMDGTRFDPLGGNILAVTGTEWSVWVKSGDDTTRYDEQSHIQMNPNGTVVRVTEDGHTEYAGTEIRRAKRTELTE